MSSGSVEFQQTPIRPVDCLKESKEILGDQYWLFLGISLVGIIIAQAVPLGILFGPMMCGIFLCYLTHMRGKPTDFGMLFKGFDYFLESFLATLIIMGVSIVVYLPLLCVLFAVIFGAVAAAGGGGDEAAAAFPLVIGLFYLAALLLNIVLTAVFAFVYPLIVDRDMKAVPAVRASVGAAWANIGGMLGLICLLFVVYLIAFMLCVIPAILALPLLMGAIAVAYRRVFPDPVPLAV